MKIEDLSKKDLIRVVAEMHDIIGEWCQTNTLSPKDMEILNTIGSLCSDEVVTANSWKLPEIPPSKTNIEILKELGILGVLRQRFGAENENDNSKDIEISLTSNTGLISEWSAWSLGYSVWWEQMKEYFDKLENR